jgi:hypothetical protein
MCLYIRSFSFVDCGEEFYTSVYKPTKGARRSNAKIENNNLELKRQDKNNTMLEGDKL